MSTEEFLNNLERGKKRAAFKENGHWQVDSEVKSNILLAFKEGHIIQMDLFVDKSTLPAQTFTPERGVRIVPGGSSVRRGAYVAPGVIIMPPSYINVGAYVDEGTMVDSHVLVGSCAQIGKNVHLSAAVQIGGVLEPIGERPVIIEDNAFIGAGAVIVEGVLVKKGAIIAPGVILSKGTPVYDCVNECVLENSREIPENAVVVSGSRPLNNRPWAKNQGLSIYCPMIIKYRDEKTNASLELENLLR